MAQALLAVGPSLQGPALLELELNKATCGTTGPSHKHGRLGGILGRSGQQLDISTGVHHAEPVSGAEVITTDAQGITVAIDVACLLYTSPSPRD